MGGAPVDLEKLAFHIKGRSQQPRATADARIYALGLSWALHKRAQDREGRARGAKGHGTPPLKVMHAAAPLLASRDVLNLYYIYCFAAD